jgi:hypothetical protein
LRPPPLYLSLSNCRQRAIWSCTLVQSADISRQNVAAQRVAAERKVVRENYNLLLAGKSYATVLRVVNDIYVRHVVILESNFILILLKVC